MPEFLGFTTPEQDARLLESIEAVRNPKCRNCGKPATCYGTYEGFTGYSCDDCCGHGCEDGHCDRLE